jgi:hypothetical protein
MQPTLMYKSESGRVFDSPAACLLDEYRILKENCHTAINCLLITPGCNPERQFDYVRRKIALCEAKAKDYMQAHQAETTGTPADIMPALPEPIQEPAQQAA